jgi:hypothetical protein
LTDIVPFGNEHRVISPTKVYRMVGNVTGVPYFLSVLDQSGDNYGAIAAVSRNNFIVAGDSIGYYVSGQNPLQKHHNFYGGDLAANSVKANNSKYYIGTDHGIFVGPSSGLYFEYQPSSAANKINEITMDFTDHGYACGDNGLLLKTLDGGGPIAEPFTKVTFRGACVGQSAMVSGITGSATYCSWYRDNVLISSSCAQPTQFFGAIGSHEIKLNGSNSLGAAQDIKTITIEGYPANDKVYTIDDASICQEGDFSLSVMNTEQDVSYWVKPASTLLNYGETPLGNGGTQSLTSIVFDQTKSFTLQAESAQNGCKSAFLDTFEILVEHPRAQFHCGLLNAEVGESVTYFDQSLEASLYSWTFDADGSIQSSIAADTALTYSLPGSKTTKLLVGTINDCFDSITKTSATVYIPGPVDSCWLLHNNSIDAQWSGVYYPFANKILPTGDGFYTCGTYNETTYASNFGDSVHFPEKDGAFVAKYNVKGVLKWISRTRYTSNTTNLPDYSNDIVEDGLGNIYWSGKTWSSFRDNEGDSIYNDANRSFLVKMNSVGKTLWTLSASRASFGKMVVDNNDDLIVWGSLTNTGGAALRINGQDVDTIWNLNTAAPGKFFLLKINPAGSIVWTKFLDVNDNNTNAINDLEVNSNNEIIVLGGFEERFALLDENGVILHERIHPQSQNGGKVYLMQVDANGDYMWSALSFMAGGLQGVYAEDMTLDQNDNIYFTGRNLATATETQHFFGADSSIIYNQNGAYYLAKINSAGQFQWVNSKLNRKGCSGRYVIERNDTLFVYMTSLANALIQGAMDTTLFYGTNDTLGILVPVRHSDRYLISHKTNGEILKVYESGQNAPSLFSDGPLQIAFGPNNSFYEIGNLAYFNGIQDFQIWGNSVGQVTGFDDVIQRIETDCAAAEYLPQTIVRQQIIVCSASYVHNGITYTDDFSYFESYASPSANDSIVLVNVLFESPSYSNMSITSCGAFDLNGTTYTNSGLYTQIIPNQAGCDSSIILELTINPRTGSETISSCDPIDFHGTTYSTSGTYAATLITAEGCDSVVTLYYTRNTSTASTTVVGIDSVEVNGQWYSSSGVYLQILVNSLGCDSVLTVTVELGFTGLHTNEQDHFLLFPNPTSDLVYLRFEAAEARVLSIFDEFGRLIRETDCSEKETTLSLACLASGRYTLRITEAANVVHRILIKQ